MQFRIPNSAFRVLLCLILVPGSAPSQVQQPVQGTVAWWQSAAIAGAILTSGLFDEAVQHATQESRTPQKDQAAAFFRHMGQPEVFATIPIAMFIGGAIGHNLPLKTAAERIAVSLVLAAAVSTTSKYVVGRERPDASEEPNVFHPFSGADAFPSGHTTMAFGLAAALSDEIHNPWASAGLFAFAAGTGWSRLNDNKHWLSDVVAGSAVGILSAQVVEQKWRLKAVPGGVAIELGGHKRS